MSFGIYAGGFAILIGGLVYGARLVHMPTHWIVVGVLVLVPLIYTQALPTQFLITPLHIPPPPGRPPAQPAGQHPRPLPHHSAVNPFAQPPIIPHGVAHIVEPPEPPQIAAGPTGPSVIGVPDGFGKGGGINGSVPWGTEPPPPPPPEHAASTPTIVRLSKGVVNAKAIYQPRPAYPQIAIIAHIQGTVVLQAIIGKDGAIQDLKVMSGNPMLIPATLNAVRTWRYQPTLLNNEPVEVLTEIDVIFKLGE